MLVIGIHADNKTPFYSELDVDVDTDSARKIHDLLSKKSNGAAFTHILCIDDDAVVAEYEDETDYDLSDPVSDEDDELSEEDEANPDGLHADDAEDIDLSDISDVDDD